MPDRAILFIPKLAVPIPNQEAIALVAGNRPAKLLQRPITARMCSDVDVENLTRRVFDDDEHIQDSNGGGNGGEEVAGHDRLGVISHERGAALIAAAITRTIRLFGHVRTNRAWR